MQVGPITLNRSVYVYRFSAVYSLSNFHKWKEVVTSIKWKSVCMYLLQWPEPLYICICIY